MSKKAEITKKANVAIGVAGAAIVAIVLSPNILVTVLICSAATISLLKIDKNIKEIKNENKNENKNDK